MTTRYRRDELLGEGAFSRVYRETDTERVQDRAVKVAKPSREAGTGDVPTNCVATGAFAWATGALRGIRPDTSMLLRAQHSTLAGIFSSDVVRVGELSVEPKSTWFVMELVEGATLRQVLGPYSPASSSGGWVRAEQRRLAVALAACLRRLEQEPRFRYHGDLKPENVLVSGHRIVLIDPGYRGPLQTVDGVTEDCIVTTPAYYPHLDPRDDLLALGLMLWELILGVQPLRSVTADVTQLPQVERLVASLLNVPRPSVLDPLVSSGLEETLLKALRLRLKDGTLELAPGFQSFAELCEALAPDLGRPAPELPPTPIP